MHLRARPLALLAATGLLVAGCGGDDPAPAASPAVAPAATAAAPAEPAGTAAPAPVATVAPGSTVGGTAAAPAAPATDAGFVAPEALRFSAPLVGGGEIDLSAGYGGQPVLFWFWAPY